MSKQGYNKSLFEGTPKKQANRSRFNLSYERKDAMLPGYLVPCGLWETLPGDQWEINSEFMFRFESLYYPIMHKFTMRADYFFIPNRILWNKAGANDGWKEWIVSQAEIPPPTASYYCGPIKANAVPQPQIFPNLVNCYLELPFMPLYDIELEEDFSPVAQNVNAFPLSGYLKVWDEYYRNPQLEEERWFNLASGDNSAAFLTAFAGNLAAHIDGAVNQAMLCLRAKWEMDYFTSALPEPQVGEAIKIPTVEDGFPKTSTMWRDTDDGDPVTDGAMAVSANETYVGGTTVYHEHDATIKQLRFAEVLQSFYERAMKVGSRYRDWIKGFFVDDPEPMNVDVPVLFGSKFGRVQVTDVTTTADTGQAGEEAGEFLTGTYRGQMNLYERDNGELRYSCREHGFIMVILQVNPNTTYGQGIQRFYRSRMVQTDYPLDMFAGIGDQEILKEELVYNYINAQLDKNEDTFGYIPRFSEMRYKSNWHGVSMNWNTGLSQHAGRIWSVDRYHTNPAIYDDFVEINEDFVSILTEVAPTYYGGLRTTDIWKSLPVNAYDDSVGQGVIFSHIFHSAYVNRMLPLYSTPKLA